MIVVGTIALAAGTVAAVYAFRHQVPEDPSTRKMVGSYDGIVGVAQLRMSLANMLPMTPY